MEEYLREIKVTNHNAKIEFYKEHWVVTYNSGKQEKKLKFDWSKVPIDWKEFWKDVCKNLIEIGSEAQSQSVLYAASYFHEWLTEREYTQSKFELNEFDVALFYEWLVNKPIKKGKTAKLSEKTLENIVYALITGFKTAFKIERPEVKQIFIETFESFCKNRLSRNRNERLYEHAKEILSTSQQQKLQQLFLQQKLEAEEILKNPTHLPNGFVKEKITRKNGSVINLPVRSVDLLVVTACWLSLHHGVRASEFLSLTVDDFVENKINQRYQLLCKAPQKPDRWVDIHHSSTISLLNLCIQWTEKAREMLDTNLIAVDFVSSRQEFEAKIIDNKALNNRIELFKKRFGLDDANEPMKITLTNLRKTFGANYASFTQNREATRMAMGHEHLSTTENYYLTQNLRDLSHNVSSSLQNYAYTLTLAYQKPMVNVNEEDPMLATQINKEPERDIDYGICTVPKTTENLSDSCARAGHCLECQYLVSEVRKRQNYIDERDEYLKLAEEETDERVKQSRLRRATELEAHLLLMDEAVKRFNSVHGGNETTEEEQKPKRRKRKYK